VERVGRLAKIVPYGKQSSTEHNSCPQNGAQLTAAVVQAKYEAESHLHTLDLDWTVIRPGGLTLSETGGVALGKVRLGNVPYVPSHMPCRDTALHTQADPIVETPWQMSSSPLSLTKACINARSIAYRARIPPIAL
jgi:hypothetical protein